MSRGTRFQLLSVALLAALLSTGLATVTAQDGSSPRGFDLFIQSGTCAEPTDDIRVGPSKEGDEFAIYPYSVLAEVDPDPDEDEGEVVMYYGSRSIPGFGVATLFGDMTYFIEIVDGETGEQVACGDIRQPSEGRFVTAATLLTQLLPVGPNGVNGVAIFEPGQTSLDAQQQEPPRVRVILLVGSDEATVPGTPTAAD